MVPPIREKGEQMSNKQNVNYFKMNDLMEYIGIGLMTISLPIFIFAYGYIWFLSCFMLPIGVVLFIIGVSIRSNEKDILNALKRKTDGVVIPYDNLGINERRINRKLQIEVLEDFEYESGLMYKRGKRGIISSKYTKTAIYMLTDALYISTKTVSLISDEAKSKKFEISYDTIEEVRIDKDEKSVTFDKKVFKVVEERLVIRHGGGYKFSVPIHADIRAEGVADRINKQMEIYKKNV